MSKTIKNIKIQHRYDTSSNWSNNDPVLLKGELGVESDTNLFKIGDGTTAWNKLGYASVSLDGYLTETKAEGLYVSKVAGKGLSTNDYTDDEKNRVANAIQSVWIGVANGVATLDVNGKLTESQIPDGLDELKSISALPQDEADIDTEVLYLVTTGGDDDENTIVNGIKDHLYRWNGTKWIDMQHAVRADADKDGNAIETTYLKKTDAENDYVSKTGYVEYTAAEKTKLAGLENYTLPNASNDTLGGIKVGTNLVIDEDGKLSVDYGNTFDDYLTTNDAKATYMPIAGGTFTGSVTMENETQINFGDNSKSISADNYTGTAAKATADASGNVIDTTYATKNELNGYVAKETDKGLSTNDYTNADKAIVDGVQSQLDDKLSLTGGEVTGMTLFDAGIKTGQITGIPVVLTMDDDGETIPNAAILGTFNGTTWTLGGGVYLPGDPTDNLGIASKQYVDNIAAEKVDVETGKGLSSNDFTDLYKAKLDNLNNYALTPATTTTLGGIMVGDGLSVDSTGKLSADVKTTDLTALTNTIADIYLTKTSAGELYELIETANASHNSLQIAIDSKVDIVDGKGLSTNDYTDAEKTKLANLNNYTLTAATTTTLGGVKVGAGLAVESDGTLSADVKTTDLTSLSNSIASTYLKSEDASNTYQSKTDATSQHSALQTSIDSKVDKVEGKSLSTNDFTNDYVNKVDNAIQSTEKGAASGVATLDANGKLNTSQLPDGWNDIKSVDVLPTTNISNDVLYYVTTGGDTSTDTIVKGTAGRMYRYVGTSGSGTWIDISSASTADKAVHDSEGNTISTTYLKSTDAASTYETITDANSKHSALQTSIDGKVDKVSGKTLTSNDFTDDYKTKLDGLSNYTLTAASADTLGGIKIGTGISINASGVVSTDVTSSTISNLNTTIANTYLTKTDATSTYATQTALTTAKTDLQTAIDKKVDAVAGKGLSTNDYTDDEKTKLAGLSNYTLPTASSTVLGGIKIGTGISINASGVVSTDVTSSTISNLNTTIANTYLTKTDATSTYATQTALTTAKTDLQTAIDDKVSKVTGKGLSTNDFTDTYKTKLDGLDNYTLPTASASVMGGVKIGSGISVDDNGTISADVKSADIANFVTKSTADSTYVAKDGYVAYSSEEKTKLAGLSNYTLPTASASTLGGIKVGDGLNIASGILSVASLLGLFNKYGTNYNPTTTTNAGWSALGLCMISYTASTITNQPTAKGILVNIPSAANSTDVFQLWLAIPNGYVAARAGDSSNAIQSQTFTRLGTEGIIPGGTISIANS